MGHAGFTLGRLVRAGLLFVGVDLAWLSDYLKQYILKPDTIMSSVYTKARYHYLKQYILFHYTLIFSIYTKRLILLSESVYTKARF